MRVQITGVVAIVSLCATAFGGLPAGTPFTYQGRLTETGMPADGPYDLRFALWTDPDEALEPIVPPVCHDGVSVTDGLFTVELDFGAAVFNGTPLWLGIEVRADATPGNCTGGAYTTLAPRQPLTPTPYAIHAFTAASAGLALPFDGEANVAIQALLDLDNIRTTGTTHTGIFRNRSTGDNSRAISGISQGTSGATSGVYGTSNSTSGTGVRGEAGAATGPTNGVWGTASSTNGIGVFGLADAASGPAAGVVGHSDSASGFGVYGIADSATGTNYGVYGLTVSPSGYAGYFTGGRNYFSGDVGIGTTTPARKLHVVASAGESAIYGDSADSAGVYGITQSNSGGAYAVAGQVPMGAGGYGVFAFGRLGATGTKPFQIDHPTDPENKYLLHYASEGPEPLNVYRGNVVLDSEGEAWVTLPDYFDAINRDPSFTLTPIGAASPEMHVAQEILNQRFLIAGGKPGMKVSWRVEAVRDDAWVRTHGAPVEVEKEGPERGRYQHPELYGQPAERGINYRPQPEPGEAMPRNNAAPEPVRPFARRGESEPANHEFE